MERWSGRVAVVTGARGGIGGAVVRGLVNKGVKVVAVDCRPLDSQVSESLKDAPGKVFSRVTDLSKEEEILSTFKWITETLGGVDILINTAALMRPESLHAGETKGWRESLEVNVLALSICTREALQIMKEKGIDDGHIVHFCSVAGVNVSDFENLAMYSATKFAVRALAEGLRKELNQLKSHIRITNICPGNVKTSFLFEAVGKEIADAVPFLTPEDVADSVLYALATPPRVQVHEIIIRPNGEA